MNNSVTVSNKNLLKLCYLKSKIKGSGVKSYNKAISFLIGFYEKKQGLKIGVKVN